MGGCIDDDAVTSRYLAGELGRPFHIKLSTVAGSLDGVDINARTVEAMRQAVPGTISFAI